MSNLVYHDPHMRYHYYLLIPHPNPHEFKVLLQRDGDDWLLPWFTPQEHHFAVVQHINDHVKATLGLAVATMRCIKIYRPSETLEERFYVLDNLDAEWVLPDTMRWFDEIAVKDLEQLPLSQLASLIAWFDWRHSDDSLRVDWMRRGWFHEAALWLHDLADRMETPSLEAPRQVRTWVRSSTLQMETASCTLYFKAVPKTFAYEPIVTRILAIRHPQSLPDVRAVQVDKAWMLMRDFGGKLLSEIDDIAIWEKAVRQFAKIQVDMTKNAQSLIALGVPDRSVDYLSSQLDKLLFQLPPQFDHIDRARRHAMVADLRNLCVKLIMHNLPLTITHGDFWAGNTIITDDDQHCLFFDWSDASVSHPFFDIASFLIEVDRVSHIDNVQERLMTVYLNEWTGFAPLAYLRQAYALAEVLHHAHQALFYFAHVLPSIESVARWELSGVFNHHLQQLLNAMDSIQPQDLS